MDTTTAITANPPAVAPPPPPDAAPRTERAPKKLYYRLLETVASLRITVVLFALSILLVLFGTLAQVDLSVITAVNTYFRSAFVWVPFHIFVPRSEEYDVYGGFPFPGGWLLGGLLMANLLAAHAIRFKVSWKRSGILLIHSGLIVMMLSELVTGLFAVESRLHLEEGKGSNYLQDHHKSELAFTTALDDKFEEEVVIPDRMLQPGATISRNDVPFDIEVIRFMENSAIVPRIPDGFSNPATRGLGTKWAAVEKASIEGTRTEGEVDTPSAYLTLKEKGSGRTLGTYMVTSHGYFITAANTVVLIPSQPVRQGDKLYYMALRNKRTYQPYTMHLIKGETEYYPNTSRPKNYTSTILLVDNVTKEKREITITMNSPLRYGGQTYFQAGMNPWPVEGAPPPTPMVSILQVVDNPGWLMPYISCAMVSIGMIIHFGLHLLNFLERRAAT